jgi:hypothetical protein
MKSQVVSIHVLRGVAAFLVAVAHGIEHAMPLPAEREVDHGHHLLPGRRGALRSGVFHHSPCYVHRADLLSVHDAGILPIARPVQPQATGVHGSRWARPRIRDVLQHGDGAAVLLPVVAATRGPADRRYDPGPFFVGPRASVFAFYANLNRMPFVYGVWIAERRVTGSFERVTKACSTGSAGISPARLEPITPACPTGRRRQRRVERPDMVTPFELNRSIKDLCA